MALENPSEAWFIFEIDVSAILNYIERQTGTPYPASIRFDMESNKWHLALREGVRNRLHLNLGIPGIEHPLHPIEENESALLAALLLGRSSLPVILSGEWELAVSEGLISKKQLRMRERAMHEAVV